MKEKLLDLISKSEIVTPLLNSKGGHFVVDDVIGVSLLFSGIYTKKPNNYLIVTSSLYNAQRIFDMISSLIGDDKVLLFPNDELIKSEL